MKVYGLWHGGASYAVGAYSDIEPFDSLADAKRTLVARYMNYEQPATPCVEKDETSIWIFEAMPDDNGDLYPDRVLSFGPRGGIKMERG